MGRARVDLIGVLSVSALLLGACAKPRPVNPRDLADANDTGRIMNAKTDSERALLKQLGSLPSGKAQRIGDETVLAEAPYNAASGHLCRALRWAPSHAHAPSHRLACTNGKHWFFVPNVFGDAVPE